MNQKKEEANQTEYLTFFVAGEEYGASILSVREVSEHRQITRVPGMPPWIRGVITLRGEAVPVVDLAARFGLNETEITKWVCFVIFELEQEGEPTAIGLIADSVSRVIALPETDVLAPPAFGTKIRADYLAGMGKIDDGVLMILNLDRALSIDELLDASQTEAMALAEA
jgi:purine-binding chemotaxis protein CheW